MLKHESEESTVPSAAQIRVTPEELSAALKALDADKQQAARLEASTVPIGAVVDELHLDSTPEQIWAQVQKQRVQEETRRAEEENQRIQKERLRTQEAAAQMSQSAAATQAAVRPRRRRWHRRWWLFLGIGWAIYGVTQGNLLPSHPMITSSSQTITINGDLTKEVVSAQGKDVVINGDLDKITLQGQARSLTVNGDLNTLSGDAPLSSDMSGNGNSVAWAAAP